MGWRRGEVGQESKLVNMRAHTLGTGRTTPVQIKMTFDIHTETERS